jgi:hypothetical protein
MSKEALEEVLRRASNDSGFRDRLSGDFDATLRSYDLTDTEKVQLRSATIDRPATSRSVPERQAAGVAASDVEASDVEAADVEAADVEAADVEAADVEAMNSEQM